MDRLSAMLARLNSHRSFTEECVSERPAGPSMDLGCANGEIVLWRRAMAPEERRGPTAIEIRGFAQGRGDMSEILKASGYAPPASNRSTLDRLEILPHPTPRPSEPELPSRFDEELQRVLSRTSFRMARLRAVRAEIEAGTFETTERIQGTVAVLLEIVR